MTLQCGHVLSQVKAIGFPRLHGYVAHVQLGRRRRLQRTPDVLDQQVGQNTCKQAARASYDEVSLQNRPHGLGIGPHPGRPQENAFDGLAGLRNRRLSMNAGQTSRLRVSGRGFSQVGDQGHVLQSGGQDAPPYGQDATCLQNGLLKTARHAGKRRDKQVAEAMAVEAVSPSKAVLK